MLPVPSGRRPAWFDVVADNATPRTTPKSRFFFVSSRALTVTMVEDLQQPEAGRGGARRWRELREGARLALTTCAWYAFKTRLVPLRATARRRGGRGTRSCAADRQLIAARMRLVALLAEKGGFIFFDGPSRRTAAWHALLRCCQCAHSAHSCGTYLRGAHGGELSAPVGRPGSTPEQPCVLGCVFGGRVRTREPLSANALFGCSRRPRPAV